MNPVQTRIALLVSLISLGWSSASAANETQIPGPLAPPEPTTPFGVPSWPENWSFDLPETTRSAHGDARLAAPEDAARRHAGRFKTASVPLSFQDYAFEGQRYVCLDVETGLLARAATGCRVPALLSDDALATAEASAFFASLEKGRGIRNPSAARTQPASGERRADLPLQGPGDELTSTAEPTGPIAAHQDRPRSRKVSARTEETSPAPTIANSTIRADLSGFHDDCPFSVPDAAELAEATSRATLADAGTAKSSRKRSAAAPKAPKIAKALAASAAEQVGKATAAERPARTAAAHTTAVKRKVTRTQAAPDQSGLIAAEGDAKRAQPGDEGAAEAVALSAATPPDNRTVLSEAVRSATQALADLRFVQEEDPFLLSDSTAPAQADDPAAVAAADAAKNSDAGSATPGELSKPLAGSPSDDVRRKAAVSARPDRTASADGPAVERHGARVGVAQDKRQRAFAAKQQAASAAAVASADGQVLPALSGAYPFWLPGDVASTATSARGAGVGSGRQTLDEASGKATARPASTSLPDDRLESREKATPEAKRIAEPRPIGDDWPSSLPADTELAAAEKSAAVTDVGTARVDVGRRSAIGAVPVEVYGALADRYAAMAAKEADLAAAEAKSTAKLTQDGVAELQQGPSALDSAPAEVYGVLADRYAAMAAKEADQAAAEVKSTAKSTQVGAELQQGPSALDTASVEVYGVLAAETPAPQPDDHMSPRRVEVDASALIGRATADLLAALEQWTAQIAKAEASTQDPAAKPAPIDRPAEGLFAKGGVAIAEAALDGVRGGFDNGSGLRIAFGIERAVYINGNLVTTTNFNVTDLGKVSSGQTVPTAGEKPNVGLLLIQNGPGNIVQPSVAQAAAGTVIQNTLNNQSINSVTLVNATVNSLQMFKGMALQSMLRSVVTSTVPR